MNILPTISVVIVIIRNILRLSHYFFFLSKNSKISNISIILIVGHILRCWIHQIEGMLTLKTFKTITELLLLLIKSCYKRSSKLLFIWPRKRRIHNHFQNGIIFIISCSFPQELRLILNLLLILQLLL